ncbi:DUF6630 family protein [Dyella mobilis]|uniref:DUF6630 domain-containing protein n=1 Tax=Dyella mobilis TaxID=1849582 RepID=A0ABS2KEG8_9GAMM|nr:hypothetical protein [Dyella mobilis]MBM7129455.1 hypothetical protein [Dyella mobilis]GLQ98282.1 hypothetical protein GCM10007863_27020 [Dyella mobilis]
MTPSDHDFDTDHDSEDEESIGDSVEACVWQLLCLINPGDEEMALQQFADYRDAIAQSDGHEAEPIDLIRRAIDWRSGFYVAVDDTRGLMQAIDELSSRWSISIDWGIDADDDDFNTTDVDAASLFATAYDGLLEHGYTLWAWETEDDHCGGWITLKRDNEPLREVAAYLGINMRPGNEVT